MDMRIFKCYDCGHKWELPYGGGRPSECPECKSTNFHRSLEDRGNARGGGRGRGRGRHRSGRFHGE